MPGTEDEFDRLLRENFEEELPPRDRPLEPHRREDEGQFLFVVWAALTAWFFAGAMLAGISPLLAILLVGVPAVVWFIVLFVLPGPLYPAPESIELRWRPWHPISALFSGRAARSRGRTL